MKTYDFVTQRDGKVELAGIEKPTASFALLEVVLNGQFGGRTEAATVAG